VESWAKRVDLDYRTLNDWSQQTVTAMAELQQQVRTTGQHTDFLGHTVGTMRTEAGKLNNYMQ
jgi:hypothetical protein